MGVDFSLPRTSWIALLSIAHRYEILNVRERAIREIFNTASGEVMSDPQWVQELVLAVEKYDVSPRNLVPWLVALVRRPEPLTENEVALFSALTMSRLASARESFWIWQAELESSTDSEPGDNQVARMICNIWKIPNDTA
jgi:hypothetical protein